MRTLNILFAMYSVSTDKDTYDDLCNSALSVYSKKDSRNVVLSYWRQEILLHCKRMRKAVSLGSSFRESLVLDRLNRFFMKDQNNNVNKSHLSEAHRFDMIIIVLICHKGGSG